jgi:hypothetical protein
MEYIVGLQGLEVKAVSEDKVEVAARGYIFVWSREDVQNNLSEGWAKDESSCSEFEDVSIEMFPHDFRHLLYEMDHFQDVEGKLIRYCVELAHEHAKDPWSVELLCRICDCTEEELESTFQRIAKEGGFDLIHVL